MRSGNENDRSSPGDAESTAGVHFTEKEVHKDCKAQLSVTSFSKVSKARRFHVLEKDHKTTS